MTDMTIAKLFDRYGFYQYKSQFIQRKGENKNKPIVATLSDKSLAQKSVRMLSRYIKMGLIKISPENAYIGYTQHIFRHKHHAEDIEKLPNISNGFANQVLKLVKDGDRYARRLRTF
jgi:hypothetical protein